MGKIFSPRSGIGADMGSLSVLGIGYENPHIRPDCLDCHPYFLSREECSPSSESVLILLLSRKAGLLNHWEC
ncbi:hypothetical protein RHMOL_Rhmol10G0149400 [Rhododendron molle]|uniref:Uncharacterized protein n=1 Tax=Rhododendron molle TaxID=49168 RepID=A0ACC0M3I5_RHOML|nr:hypothetical protein RHMOL_Rhmol10G0149400 [Rhododendron molle]